MRPFTSEGIAALAPECGEQGAFAGVRVERRFREIMPPGPKLIIDVDGHTLAGSDRRDDGGKRKISRPSAERFEVIELLPFGEQFGRDFAQQLVDVGSSALGRESEGESSPLAACEFFGGFGGFVCSVA